MIGPMNLGMTVPCRIDKERLRWLDHGGVEIRPANDGTYWIRRAEHGRQGCRTHGHY